MKIFIADFESTPFDYQAKDNYFINSRFLCAKLVCNTKYRNPNKKKWYYFNVENNKVQKLYDFIMFNCSLSNPSIFYFHNLRFDLALIYNLLPKQYSYQVIINSSKILSLRVFKEYKRYNKKGKETIYKKTLFELRDTLVLLMSSADKIGHSLGYLKKEIDYTMKVITKEYIYYCRRDIRIIEKALNKLLFFMKEFYHFDITINELPLTLPALGKKVFHKILYSNGINGIKGKEIYDLLYDNSHRNLEYETILREYYYGGRVEIFNLNVCKKGVYNDFNSFYGSIMLKNKFPLQPYSREQCIESENCWQYWKKNEKIFGIECELNEVINEIPLIVSKINGKLVFAKGKKDCFLFRKEIEYLLKLGLKQKDIKIKYLWYCSDYAYIFKDFVSIAYSIKNNYKHNSFEYYMSKIFMLSVYGKFAEKRIKEQIEIINSLEDLPETELRKVTSLNLNSNEYIKRENITYNKIKINVVFSMMISALSRLKLHKEILKSKKPFYTDSDSIVSSDIIENSDKIGHMKPEFYFDKFQALGCKEYVIETMEVRPNPVIAVPLKSVSVKMKGFGKLNYDNFNVFVKDYFKPKRQNRMIGFMESFNRNLAKNLILVFDKFKSNVYDKRWILPDLTTKAFDLRYDNFNDLIKNNEFYINQIIDSYE